MERIKQAIEEAKSPRIDNLRRKERESESSKSREGVSRYQISFSIPWVTVKYVTAAIFIFFAGWMWLRLDFMNQIEQITSQFINDSIRTARAEIKRRTEDEEKFRQVLKANLAHCIEVAEKDKQNYIQVISEQVRLKNINDKSHSEKNRSEEKFVIPRAALQEADRLMETAKAECAQIYESHLNHQVAATPVRQ